MEQTTRRGMLHSTWTLYAAAALLSLVTVWFARDLGSIDWRVPLYFNGDALAVASHFKTVIETGWYESQPLLGAPYGQHYNDYPTADNLHFFAALVLSVFSHDFGFVMNLYFLLGFPLAAMAAVWFLRLVGVSRILSVALAVVYALAPYHFVKGEGHLFLASYYVVPLALGLVYLVGAGRPIWRMRADGRWFVRILTWQNAGVLAICLLLGTASSYYSIFFLLLLAIAGIAAFWRMRVWPRFLGAAGSGLIVVAAVLLNMLPDLLYRLQNGTNAAVFLRSPPEAEHYSFKIAQLLLPMPEHRFGPFRELRSLYDQFYPLPSEQPALGLIAASGFVALCVLAVLFLLSAGQLGARPARNGWRTNAVAVRTLSVLAGLTLIALLFGTVGSLSTLLSFVSFPIRAWNRLSIFVALLCLAAVGILLDLLVRRILRGRAFTATRNRAWLVSAPIAVLLIAVAVWDQVPPVNHDAVAQRDAKYASDEAFAEVIETRVDPDCLIFQLPYIAFPESPPVNGVFDTAQLRLFLHSETLHWSGGGIKGRPEIDRLGDIAALPPHDLVDAITEEGACGVVVDRAAYADQAQATVDALAAVTKTHAVTSDDSRFTFLPLR